ncbi:PREDICTED: pumilio homolog 15-like [Theobroma cacao]|uniref:S-protein homolog n=1 Tax=Theobroma cacao TaxID=3641 RepID=A0AB32WFN0_THECC|nr:PREDICTED: pumilio homolog 15-like [Theobroma cacao]
MRNTRNKTFAILLLLLFSMSRYFVMGKILVRVMNQLGNHRTLNIHCQSRDNDLGYVALPDGSEFEWKFSVNFWGTTLFYCNVQWDQSGWHHFDAYAYEWDSSRCQTECIWKISKDAAAHQNCSRKCRSSKWFGAQAQ